MNWTPQYTAYLVLAAFLAGLALRVWLWFRQVPHQFIYQRVLFFIDLLMTRVLWRTEVVGRFNLPPGHGAVIIANHRSSVDPCFIQIAQDRVVHWFVAKEYFDLPLVGRLLELLQTIPTSRAGVDTAATRRAIRHVQRGELVGMLPEGRINDTDQLLLPGRPGAVLVAVRAGVPIIPCYIDGAPYNGTVWSSLFMPARVRLVIGEPIDVSKYNARDLSTADMREITMTMLKAIAALAGRPDFQPSIAGRRWKP
jgi:1-acyl-sn-glycerol-3-phosphate acyltransferase